MEERIVLFNDEEGMALFFLKVKNWDEHLEPKIEEAKKQWDLCEDGLPTLVKKTLTEAGYVFEEPDCDIVTL